MNATDGTEALQIGAAARSLGVSVRTLHHWHQLGVASPSGRTSAGYREYLPADVAQLRRVLLLRNLGVPLAAIPALLNADSNTRRAELERRQAELRSKIVELQALATEVEQLLDADQRGVLLPDSGQREIFGSHWNPSWSAAAREQWGDSPQWAEYAERSSQRGSSEWREISRTMSDLTTTLAQAKRDGVTPGSIAANSLAEMHRAALSEYFHCTHSMQVLVARRYASEAGFISFYEHVEPGLAAWLKQIVDANARAAGIDPDSAVWA